MHRSPVRGVHHLPLRLGTRQGRPTSQLHAPHVVHRIGATLVVYIAVAMPCIYFHVIFFIAVCRFSSGQATLLDVARVQRAVTVKHVRGDELGILHPALPQRLLHHLHHH